MKKIFDFDFDLDTNGQTNFYTRTSRNNSRNKSDERYPISKIEDFQISMSAFSTRIESKNNAINSDNNHKKKKIKNEKKKVKFNPLITVVNIESFKKEIYEGTFDQEAKCSEEI